MARIPRHDANWCPTCSGNTWVLTSTNDAGDYTKTPCPSCCARVEKSLGAEPSTMGIAIHVLEPKPPDPSPPAPITFTVQARSVDLTPLQDLHKAIWPDEEFPTGTIDGKPGWVLHLGELNRDQLTRITTWAPTTRRHDTGAHDQ